MLCSSSQALLSALYFGLTSTVWAVTGEFTRLGGEILQVFGVDVSGWEYYQMVKLDGSTWTRPDGWIVWGMFIGALMMVLLSNSFKVRLLQQKRRYVQGFVGGIIPVLVPAWRWGATWRPSLPGCR